MQTTTPSNIVLALEILTPEEIDRVRCTLERRFGNLLRNISDALNTDDLLHEAIEDLLEDKRHCQLDRVKLTICLMNIVRSKVSHLYEKWKKDGIIKEPQEVLEYDLSHHNPKPQSSELRGKILQLVKDDPVLLKIVEYRLEHPEEEPIKAKKLTEVFGMDIKEIYNANRRLKSRLEGLF